MVFQCVFRARNLSTHDQATIVFVPKTLQIRAITGPPSTSGEAISEIRYFSDWKSYNLTALTVGLCRSDTTTRYFKSKIADHVVVLFGRLALCSEVVSNKNTICDKQSEGLQRS
jgi:hypothetical protein